MLGMSRRLPTLLAGEQGLVETRVIRRIFASDHLDGVTGYDTAAIRQMARESDSGCTRSGNWPTSDTRCAGRD